METLYLVVNCRLGVANLTNELHRTHVTSLLFQAKLRKMRRFQRHPSLRSHVLQGGVSLASAP